MIREDDTVIYSMVHFMNTGDEAIYRDGKLFLQGDPTINAAELLDMIGVNVQDLVTFKKKVPKMLSKLDDLEHAI